MQTHGCDDGGEPFYTDFEEHNMDAVARKTIIRMRQSNLLVQFP
jgi:hypothetical protein